MNASDQYQLECMIDAYGLTSVIETLSRICHEKSEHVKTHWSSCHTRTAMGDNLAQTWSRQAKRIERFAEKLG